MNRPLFLLLLTGCALGLNFPLGKLAAAAGIAPLLWAAFISFGAGIAMATIQLVSNDRGWRYQALVRYSIISGFLSYVVPNGLTFMLIPRIGSGLTAIMFALSPVFTALLSLALRVRPPNRPMLAGIAFGLAGALLIVTGRNNLSLEGDSMWVLVALLIPLFLGLGNVYRTLAWPEGVPPRTLAASTNLAAVVPLLALSAWQDGRLSFMTVSGQPILMLAQLLVSTAMFIAFFRLQHISGPTYLSQIGYVAAAVGLIIGVTILGEHYAWPVWTGAAMIAAGLAVSTWGQRRA